MSQVAQTPQGQNPRFSCGADRAAHRPAGARLAAVVVRRRTGAIRRHRQRAAGGPGRRRLQRRRTSRATTSSTARSSTRRASTRPSSRTRRPRRTRRRPWTSARRSRQVDQLGHAERDDPVHRAGRRRRASWRRHLDPGRPRRRPGLGAHQRNGNYLVLELTKRTPDALRHGQADRVPGRPGGRAPQPRRRRSPPPSATPR